MHGLGLMTSSKTKSLVDLLPKASKVSSSILATKELFIWNYNLLRLYNLTYFKTKCYCKIS
jgi:hypothetical protein